MLEIHILRRLEPGTIRFCPGAKYISVGREKIGSAKITTSQKSRLGVTT